MSIKKSQNLRSAELLTDDNPHWLFLFKASHDRFDDWAIGRLIMLKNETVVILPAITAPR